MLGRLIKQAGNALAQEMNKFARQYNLTGTQMSIIDFLGNFPGNNCDQQAIEKEFAIKRSTTAILLQRMAKSGLVVRRPALDDRRRKVVALTEKGQELFPIVSAYIKKEEVKMLSQLSSDEQATIISFLQRIIEEDA